LETDANVLLDTEEDIVKNRNVKVDAKMVERVLLQTLVNANPDLRVSIVNDEFAIRLVKMVEDAENPGNVNAHQELAENNVKYCVNYAKNLDSMFLHYFCLN